jgi:hypothetical protein
MAIADLLGWAAAALTLLTFYCSNMQRLRLLALSANCAFVAYAAMAGLTPVLALHLTLIPLNLYRLMQVRQRVLANAAVELVAPGKSGPLGTARPVDRFVLEHRVARMQMGGCTSSLRKPFRSRPRRPIGAATGVASWPVRASILTDACPPSTRLDEASRRPHLVARQPAEQAVADDAGEARQLSVAWPQPSLAGERLALMPASRLP